MIERMYAVVITEEGGARRRLAFSKPELTVGRVQGNDIVLSKRNVSKQHARLTLKDDQPVVVDLNSTNGTWVNGRKITAPCPLKQGDKIYIADFIITLEAENGGSERESAAPRMSEPPPLPAKQPVPAKSSFPVRQSLGARRPMPADARSFEPKAGRATSLPPRIERRETDEAHLPAKTETAIPAIDPLTALLDRLADRIDIDNVEPAAMKNQERWSAARAAIAETFLTMQTAGTTSADLDMRRLAHIALHEAVGLGALDDVLSDESVRTIVVNGPAHVFIDKGQGLQAASLTFSSEAALLRVARRLAAQAGQALQAQPVLHGRLAFGPRLTILQPPLVAKGPMIELHVSSSKSLAQLAEKGWMSADAASYLAKAVAECRNIVVAGPRGSGVRQMMSALARELPESESIVAIEALPDLDIDRSRVIALTAASSGMSMTEAIEHGTRLQCEHLVISDLAGAPTMTALAAVLGREPGHLLGVHCWSAKDAMEGLMLAAGCSGADRICIAQTIGSAIHLVVAMQRGPEGERVSAILEVQGHQAGDVSYQSAPF
jgi:pilus assembly protein CpaF